MPSSKPLLCDAAAVIGAYQAGVWDPLVKKCTVAVTGIVVGESHHYPDGRGNRRLIHLASQVAAGTIEQHDATLDELKSFDDRIVDRQLASALDPGEREALALIVERGLPHVLCTGDGPGIRALCHLGIPAKAISLERVLSDLGITVLTPLREDLREAKFQQHIARGKRERKDLGLD